VEVLGWVGERETIEEMKRIWRCVQGTRGAQKLVVEEIV